MKLIFDISATEFVTVRNILADIVPPGCRVWVFGSRAKNQARFNSDLDLALECKDKLPPIILHKLKEAFSDSRLPYRVDVLDINDVSENFQTIIRQKAIAFPLAKSTKVPALRFSEFNREWKTDRLSKSNLMVVDGDRGVNYPQKKDFSQSGYCLFLNAKNVTKFGFSFEETAFISQDKDTAMSKGKLNRGDLLLTTRGSVGHVALFDNTVKYENIRINSGMVILRSTDRTDSSSFLFFLFNSPKVTTQIRKTAFGSAQPQLTVKEIKRFWLTKPQSAEQQKIASFLSAIDTKIAQITKKKALLEQYKRGAMQKLFSQELRFKDAQGKAFPEWAEKRLNKIARKTASSVTAQSLEETPGKYPVFGASGIVGYVDFYNSAPPHISVVKDGAGIGRVFLCPKQSSVLGTLDSIIAYDRSHTAFVFYWLSQISFEPYRTGSTIPHVYFRDYGRKKGWFPHPDEQQKVADFLSAIDQKIDMVATQLNHAKTFKKGLLQQMFI